VVHHDGSLELLDDHESEVSPSWLVHLVLFLSSPTVTIVDADDRLTWWRRAEARSSFPSSAGLIPVPQWILLKKYRKETTVGIGGFKHRFRYDVRGHWMTFKRGRLAGRVLWCPAHQRGLANEIYRPAHYRGISGP